MRPRLTSRRAVTFVTGIVLLGGQFAFGGSALAITDGPDLSITKSTKVPTLTSGTSPSYDLVVANVGNASDPGPITVTDSVPAGLTPVSAVGSGWSCSISGQTVTCTRPGPIAASTTLPTISLVVLVSSSASLPASIENCASIASQRNLNAQNDLSCVGVKTATPASGTLCVDKYNDLNGNGTKDANEPYLANWTFKTTNPVTGAPITLTTDASGHACIERVPVGSYTVTETAQPGWVAIAPATGSASTTVAENQTATLVFGNQKDRCCLTFVFSAGKKDNFSLSNGASAEPATPAPLPSSWPTSTVATFDWARPDRGFSHRFVLPAGNCVSAATLEIRVKPLPADARNDSIQLKIPGGASWSKLFNNLSYAATPSYYWMMNKPARTFIWNLASLPLGGANLIASLNQRRVLDTYIQDDTSVDYIRLTVTFCDCEATLTGGGSATPK